MSKWSIVVGWQDTPHLSEADKAQLAASYMPHELDARTKGIPSLGAGAIYPVPESDFVIEPFEIPGWMPRAYGLDIGWNRTAAVWAARDLTDDVTYIYSEYYRGAAEPAVHSQAILARGDWIPGVIDPAANGRSQRDGERMLEVYRRHGLLNLQPANNAVEAGIYEVWSRLSSGRLKVFSSCQNWLAEYRLYRRNERGAIVKEFDHLMDASRYLIVSGLANVTTKPSARLEDRDLPRGLRRSGYSAEYDALSFGQSQQPYGDSFRSKYVNR